MQTDFRDQRESSAVALDVADDIGYRKIGRGLVIRNPLAAVVTF